jgi:hypothetical protein
MAIAQHLDRLRLLAPIVRDPATLWIQRVQERLGLRLLVVSTWRDVRQQMALYQQGRTYHRETGEWEETDPTKVVTRAKPGTSAHNVVTREGMPASLALDVVPLTPDGRAAWDTPAETWTRLYELAADCGLDPYGDAWGASFPTDKGHVEEPGWKWKLNALGLILPTAGGVSHM